jgi:hypothetical protein
MPIELFGMRLVEVRRGYYGAQYRYVGKGVSAVIVDDDDGVLKFAISWPDATLVTESLVTRPDELIQKMRRALVEAGHRVFGGAK